MVHLGISTEQSQHGQLTMEQVLVTTVKGYSSVCAFLSLSRLRVLRHQGLALSCPCSAPRPGNVSHTVGPQHSFSKSRKKPPHVFLIAGQPPLCSEENPITPIFRTFYSLSLLRLMFLFPLLHFGGLLSTYWEEGLI